jgi:hypothetical protein
MGYGKGAKGTNPNTHGLNNECLIYDLIVTWFHLLGDVKMWLNLKKKIERIFMSHQKNLIDTHWISRGKHSNNVEYIFVFIKTTRDKTMIVL